MPLLCYLVVSLALVEANLEDHLFHERVSCLKEELIDIYDMMINFTFIDRKEIMASFSPDHRDSGETTNGKLSHSMRVEEPYSLFFFP